ncbi:unnamed protein product [Pleuronectes platessa]|uniref:Uncharacterized protein n=1 Tax=Pleuronectes platessa TaxID=8262 RepID=A0A9N7VYC0_PLEPL|nr:unnamed protein product [Pleuronectes platessa]
MSSRGVRSCPGSSGGPGAELSTIQRRSWPPVDEIKRLLFGKNKPASLLHRSPPRPRLLVHLRRSSFSTAMHLYDSDAVDSENVLEMKTSEWWLTWHRHRKTLSFSLFHLLELILTVEAVTLGQFFSQEIEPTQERE